MFLCLSKNILAPKIQTLYIRFPRFFSGRPGFWTLIAKSEYSKNPDVAKIGTFQGVGDGNVETKLSNKVCIKAGLISHFA
jgi:hypothetical protein